jgi:hypothetical protein
MVLHLECCMRTQDILLYCTTSRRSHVTSDWESNRQHVSALPVTAQELLGVCVLRVSVFSVLNSMPQCHFVRLYLILIISWQSWSHISEGKAVLSDGGCCQFLSEQVLWSIVLRLHLSSCEPYTRSPCTKGVCYVRYWLVSHLIIWIVFSD